VDKNDFQNVEQILPHDQVKFVICDRADYEWAKEILLKYQLNDLCEVLFSPSYMQQPAGELADWVLQDRLPVRLQIQLHKFLWGDAKGR
jgi:7-carboxy-7-deazaguanine synthase